jgi:hypothetical protein
MGERMRTILERAKNVNSTLVARAAAAAGAAA